MNPPTAPQHTAHTPKEALASEHYPFPWHRHNCRILASNGAIVAILPSSMETEGLDAIGHVVERGDIIEGYTGKMTLRRNDWLETRVAQLEEQGRKLISHFDAIIAAEGEEFSCGAFDMAKDTLDEAREVIGNKTDVNSAPRLKREHAELAQALRELITYSAKEIMMDERLCIAGPIGKARALLARIGGGAE